MTVEGPGLEPALSNPYTRLLAKSEQAHRLLSAHWELTYRCNETCTHCYLDVFRPHADVPGELTTEECLRVIDQLAELGAMQITFSGGEILVHRDFFRIAEYARSKRFLIRLYTNGIMISPGVADRIAALHPYSVEISLYSTSPETHDGITQLKHSWELSTRALRLLHQRGVRTVLKTPVMRANIHEIDALEAFAQELGAQFRFDITLTPKDSGDLAPLAHAIRYDELVAFFRDHIEPSAFLGRTISADEPTCGIAASALVLDPYGNVYPCLQVRTVAGNVRERPLRAIWETSPLWERLGRLTVNELPVCRRCELRGLCVRCHGLALAEEGDLRAPGRTNCLEALVRRQALVERGDLPADYPVPAHLKSFYEGEDLSGPSAARRSNFIPLATLSMQPRSARALSAVESSGS